MNDQTDFDVIDCNARGMRCPMPVLRLRRLLDDHPGARIKIIADDPVAKTDIPAFCREVGATIADQGDADPGFWFLVTGKHI